MGQTGTGGYRNAHRYRNRRAPRPDGDRRGRRRHAVRDRVRQRPHERARPRRRLDRQVREPGLPRRARDNGACKPQVRFQVLLTATF